MSFTEIKLFQVKTDKTAEFEELVLRMKNIQHLQKGSESIEYIKRFYTINGTETIENGHPPREISRIINCVKYFSCWKFDSKENYGQATKNFFEMFNKELMRYLIAPFDINIGYAI